MNNKTLIVIEGPTASGKTSLSVELAKRINTVILSADSRQFYKELSIGTAKPSKEEQQGIKHYFIDSHSIHEEITSGQYAEQALEILEKEFKLHDNIIMVGGSGMFIDAVCIGLDPIPKSDEIKLQVEKEFQETGLEPLLKELKEKDFNYFQTVDIQNPMRIMRAIEVIRLTGIPYSEQRKNSQSQKDFKIKRFVINHPREILYDRINLRVDMMIEQGLIDEVKAVEPFRNLTSLNTVGYKEIFDFLNGQTTIEIAIDKIKQNTRRYAKRQLTWFRRHPDAVWIDYKSNEEMCDEIMNNFEF